MSTKKHVQLGNGDVYDLEDMLAQSTLLGHVARLLAIETKLDTIETGAEVNQNAFSIVKVGSTQITADNKRDVLELAAGSNVTLTPDANNDKVTIAATNTTYGVASTAAAGLCPKLGGGTSNFLRADGTWASPASATYDVATTTSNGLMSAADKVKLNGIPSNAAANQNAFSNVKVGSTTVAADGQTDTLELVAGSNVTLTPDANNDKVTIAATNTNTWRGIQNNLTSTSTTDSLSAYQGKVLNDGKAAKSEAIKNITRSGTTFTATRADGTTFTFTQQDNNTTYSSQAAASGGTAVSLCTTGEKYTWNNKASTAVATTSANGLMSASDKSKLDGLTYANIASKFKVQYLIAENVSMTGNGSNSNISIPANLSGYATIGVVGYAIQPATSGNKNPELVSVVRVRLGEIDSNNVVATLKSRSSEGAKVNFGVYVLYFKKS